MGRKLEPIHPGEILAEDFMAPLHLTANKLALDLHVPANRLSEVIRGRRSVSADTALRLARYFDTSAELWLGLQAEYDLRKARESFGKQIAREVQNVPSVSLLVTARARRSGRARTSRR